MAVPGISAAPMASPGPMASGVSAPTPSLGAETAVIAKVRTAIQILSQAVGSVDVTGELGKAVMKAITDLAKVAPSSQATAGTEATAQMSAAKDAQKKAMLMAMLQKAAAAHGGAPGAPGAAQGPAAGAPPANDEGMQNGA